MKYLPDLYGVKSEKGNNYVDRRKLVDAVDLAKQMFGDLDMIYFKKYESKLKELEEMLK